MGACLCKPARLAPLARGAAACSGVGAALLLLKLLGPGGAKTAALKPAAPPQPDARDPARDMERKDSVTGARARGHPQDLAAETLDDSPEIGNKPDEQDPQTSPNAAATPQQHCHGLAACMEQPEESTADESALRLGSRVETHGLQRQGFNGLRGTCKRWQAETGRWVVVLDNVQEAEKDKEGSFKPENLKVIPGQEIVDRDREAAAPELENLTTCLGHTGGSTKPGSTLKPGSKVETHGLQRQEFNGLRGTCKRWLAEKGRWIVVWDNVQEAEKHKEGSFKPENLKVIPGQEIVDWDGEAAAPEPQNFTACLGHTGESTKVEYTLKPGSKVETHGLQRQEFNGLHGTCKRWLAEKGRWIVAMDNVQEAEKDKEGSFKPENLKVILGQETVDRDGEAAAPELENLTACLGHPGESTKAEYALKPGSKVETHGLQRQEFNGLHGTCKRWLAEKGRWIVVLDNVQEAEKDKEGSFKPENLKFRPGQEIVVKLFSSLNGNSICDVTLGAGSSIGDLKLRARKALQHKTVRLMLGDSILKHDSTVGDSGLYNGCAVVVYKLPNTMQLSQILGESLVNGSLERVELTNALEGPKILGILIDGNWCRHSRPFVFGKLKPFYDKVNEVSKRFEVVFCSDTEDDFVGYRALFPKDCKWFAVPFKAREVIAKINQENGGYGTDYVPNLTFITPSGEIIERRKDLPQGPHALDYLQHLEHMADAKMSLGQ